MIDPKGCEWEWILSLLRQLERVQKVLDNALPRE